ncbi:MAG: peptide deformylase [Patescibacteria group bacterium]|nr:peptide deformylase [Patescibacteria group bacterium]
MKIITIPHPTLRKTAKEVTTVDKKIVKFVSELEKTLDSTKNPKGVGLAATQVDDLHRIFATHFDNQLRSFINPEIISASDELVLGPEGKEPYLEGCLSIPSIYGPVFRHDWLDLRYQTIEGDTLISHQEHFTDYNARVIQHELDHLNGVLFIDYTLEFGLELYKENSKTKKLEEVDPSLFAYV